jgi:hypothetical protein
MNVYRVAAEDILCGALVADNGAGLAVNASSSEAGPVIGVAGKSVSSGDGFEIQSGIYLIGGTGEMYAGTTVYASDNDTVTASSNDCKAGIVMEYDATEDGYWVALNFPRS